MSATERNSDKRIIRNVTSNVTKGQLENVTFPVIPTRNIFCFNSSMKNTLKDIRKKLKLNQDDFAEIIKKSRVHVSRLENGADPLPVRQAREFVDLINKHYGKRLVEIEDFFPAFNHPEITEQEKAFLTLFRNLDEADKTRFLNMAEAYAHTETQTKEKR